MNTVSSVRTITVSNWNRGETRSLLEEVPGAYRMRIDEVLLSALALTLRDWTGGGGVRAGCGGTRARGAGCGRGCQPDGGVVHLGLSRGFDRAGRRGPGEGVLKSVKERVRSVPRGGVGYGMLRYGFGGSRV